MLGSIGKKIFGTRNDRILKGLTPLVTAVNELESRYESMSDAELKQQTELFRARLAAGETTDQLLPEAFAVVREGAKRVLRMRHFDVQIVGGIVLHQGKISEMKTGEGKTLVATLPAYLNALSGKGVHIVTVNDYLARRDAEWMGRLYNFLGLSVGVVYSGIDEHVKRQAYRSDITYGQNNEFGFDYLRDNMKYSTDEMFQRGHHYAIVDEVDSILIDEARTPLIISGPAEESTEKYYQINKIIPQLRKDEHYEVDLKSKQPTLSEDGISRAEALLSIDNLYDPRNIEYLHHLSQALRAHTTLERDVDYVVKDGQVIIVDEFTGRLMPGRRWSDGLHQAVEAKEGLKVARENQTLASITFQNFFRMYQKLSGMTGTADTEAPEFYEIYKLEVVSVPTNRPMVRADETDRVFRTRREKYEAVADDLAEINATGQPVLVGTVSIEQSESLSRVLTQKGVKHNVLNAKQHEREAEIVAQAGRYGSVTISTNMAGRGTDIVLGGNAGFMAAAAVGTKNPDDPKYQEAYKTFAAQCQAEREKVVAAGGLFIMGTERHESRRIDNQLRGRAGRQGDPGTSRFYVSLEDDLMKRFGGERLQAIMSRLGWEEGVAIDGRLISRSIESAQERVERFHFEARKHVTEYDDVMNKQRQVIYNLRSRILFAQGIREEILTMIDDLLEDSVLAVFPERGRLQEEDRGNLLQRYTFLFNHAAPELPGTISDQQSCFDLLREYAKKAYAERAVRLQQKLDDLKVIIDREQATVDATRGTEVENPFSFTSIERSVILETLDHFWNLHLREMDYLREGIGLRGYSQKNPLHEYQKEGFVLFQSMLAVIKEHIIRKLSFFDVQEPQELIRQIETERARRAAMAQKMKMLHDSASAAGPTPPQNQGATAPAEGSAETADPRKDPAQERARLEAQRKERRRQARK